MGVVGVLMLTSAVSQRSNFKDAMFLSVSRHGIKLPYLSFCDGTSAAANVTTNSGLRIGDALPVNETCAFWHAYFNDPENRAKTGVYAQRPGGLATQGVVHAEWLGSKLYGYLSTEAPRLDLAKVGVAAHNEPRVIATAESMTNGFFASQTPLVVPQVFQSSTLDTVMDEGLHNSDNSKLIPAVCQLAGEKAVAAQMSDTYNSAGPNEYFFQDGQVPSPYSVEGFGLICEHLDLPCHLKQARRRLSALIIDAGSKLRPRWGGGYWGTYTSGLPSVDAGYMGLVLVQRLVGGFDEICTTLAGGHESGPAPTKVGGLGGLGGLVQSYNHTFECSWAALSKAQAGYDRLNALYDGEANLNRFSMPSLVTTLLALLDSKIASIEKEAGTAEEVSAAGEAERAARETVVSQTLPGDSDVKLLFGHDVQLNFLGAVLGYPLVAPGQLWSANTPIYGATVGFRLQHAEGVKQGKSHREAVGGGDEAGHEWQVQPVFLVSNAQTMHTPSAADDLLVGPLGPTLEYQQFRTKLLAAVTPDCTFSDNVRTLLRLMQAGSAAPEPPHGYSAVIVVCILVVVAVAGAAAWVSRRKISECAGERMALFSGRGHASYTPDDPPTYELHVGHSEREQPDQPLR
jgi:hypothetical protein